MAGMHTIFIMYAPIIGICFICAVLIRDEGVAEKDSKSSAGPLSEKKAGVESGAVTPNGPPVGRQAQV